MEEEHKEAQEGDEPFKPAKEGGEKNTGMAVVAYIVFFIPLLTESKNDPFVKFHVKQGLVLFLAWLAISVISIMVPPLMMVTWVFQIGLVVLAILGIVNAVNGKEEELPLIGQFASKFNF